MGGCGCNGNQKASMLFKDCGCGCKGKKQEHKFVISVMSALIFFVVANPETFQVVRRLVGGWVSSPTGCPTIRGLMLHSLVFMLVVWGLMNIRREGMENEMPTPTPDPDLISGDEAQAAINAVKNAGGSGGDVTTTSTASAEVSTAQSTAGETSPTPARRMAGETSPTPAMDSVDVNSDDEMEEGPSPANMGPPPAGQTKMSQVEAEDMTDMDTLAPYAPLNGEEPSAEMMAEKTMGQKLGGPVGTTQPQEALRMGNYMQCKCGDGSHVMLMK